MVPRQSGCRSWPTRRSSRAGCSATRCCAASPMRHPATSAQVALAWVLAQPGVFAIPEAGTPEHVRENARALQLLLSQDDSSSSTPPSRRRRARRRSSCSDGVLIPAPRLARRPGAALAGRTVRGDVACRGRDARAGSAPRRRSLSASGCAGRSGTARRTVTETSGGYAARGGDRCWWRGRPAMALCSVGTGHRARLVKPSDADGRRNSRPPRQIEASDMTPRSTFQPRVLTFTVERR